MVMLVNISFEIVHKELLYRFSFKFLEVIHKSREKTLRKPHVPTFCTWYNYTRLAIFFHMRCAYVPGLNVLRLPASKQETAQETKSILLRVASPL